MLQKNLQFTSQKEETYSELDAGEKVRIMKKKGISEQEKTNHLLNGEYAEEGC